MRELSGEITASKTLEKVLEKPHSQNRQIFHSAGVSYKRVFSWILHPKLESVCWREEVAPGWCCSGPWNAEKTGLKPAGTIPVAAIPHKSPPHFHFSPPKLIPLLHRAAPLNKLPTPMHRRDLCSSCCIISNKPDYFFSSLEQGLDQASVKA